MIYIYIIYIYILYIYVYIYTHIGQYGGFLKCWYPQSSSIDRLGIFHKINHPFLGFPYGFPMIFPCFFPMVVSLHSFNWAQQTTHRTSMRIQEGEPRIQRTRHGTWAPGPGDGEFSEGFTESSVNKRRITRYGGWWFEPFWKILVNWDD